MFNLVGELEHQIPSPRLFINLWGSPPIMGEVEAVDVVEVAVEAVDEEVIVGPYQRAAVAA